MCKSRIWPRGADNRCTVLQFPTCLGLWNIQRVSLGYDHLGLTTGAQCSSSLLVLGSWPPVGLVVTASASTVADLGLIPVFCVDLFQGQVCTSDLRTGIPVTTLLVPWRLYWHRANQSQHWPFYAERLALVRHLAFKGQCWDWLAWYQHTVTGLDRKFDLYLSGSMSEQIRPRNALACCWDVDNDSRRLFISPCTTVGGNLLECHLCFAIEGAHFLSVSKDMVCRRLYSKALQGIPSVMKTAPAWSLPCCLRILAARKHSEQSFTVSTFTTTALLA